MNSIWNKNFAAFKNRFPQFAEILQEDFGDLILKFSDGETEIPFWNVVRAKNGQFSASENGIRLHSSYNPQKEAFNAVDVKEIRGKGTTVFYGFALGYHLVEWSKLYPQKKLVAIEPDVSRFLAAMLYVDFTDVFKVQNLVFAVGCPADSVIQLLENGKKVNIGGEGVCDSYFFDIPAFTAHAKDYFEQVKVLVKRNLRKNQINAATLKKFGKLWCRNSLKNIEKYAFLDGISLFENKNSFGLPFFVVGAGPSVEDILPYLCEIKKRCIIVCVETVLQAFLKAKVEPDFVILTDPQFWAYRHIAALSAPNAILVTEVSVYPSVFDFECKKILLCNSQFPVGNYFERKLGIEKNLGDLGTGGSVASCAWNFAKFCGAKEIFTVGLDFSFPNRQTHLKGSSAEQTFHTVSSKINSAEKQTLQVLFGSDVSFGKSYEGNNVLTDSRMKMFAWWFESRLARCPEIKTYVLSKKGLKIPGIEVASLDDFLKRKTLNSERNSFLFDSHYNEKNPAEKKSCSAKIRKIKEDFPNEDFFEEFSFLKDYL